MSPVEYAVRCLGPRLTQPPVLVTNPLRVKTPLEATGRSPLTQYQLLEQSIAPWVVDAVLKPHHKASDSSLRRASESPHHICGTWVAATARSCSLSSPISSMNLPTLLAVAFGSVELERSSESGAASSRTDLSSWMLDDDGLLPLPVPIVRTLAPDCV